MNIILTMNDHGRICRKVEEMLGVFYREMKNKYKDDIIKSAEMDQKKYENSGEQVLLEEEIKRAAKKKFESIFKGNISNSMVIIKPKNILVFRGGFLTKTLKEDLWNICSEIMFASFSDWIAEDIKHFSGIKYVVRGQEFKSDEAFRDYLSENKYVVLMGSEYAFGCEDYDQYSEHYDFLNERDCRFIPGAAYGIASVEDSIHVCLDDVDIKIHSPELYEIDVEETKQGEAFLYSPTSGISIEFGKQELENYIKNERKFVEIYFDVTIGIEKGTGKDIGAVIECE